MRVKNTEKKKTKRKRILCTVMSENSKLHDNYKDNTVFTLYDRCKLFTGCLNFTLKIVSVWLREMVSFRLRQLKFCDSFTGCSYLVIQTMCLYFIGVFKALLFRQYVLQDVQTWSFIQCFFLQESFNLYDLDNLFLQGVQALRYK